MPSENIKYIVKSKFVTSQQNVLYSTLGESEPLLASHPSIHKITENTVIYYAS